MIKKIFKAMLMGLWESRIVRKFVLGLIVVGWLPLLSLLIMKIFKISMTVGELILLTFFMAILGMAILYYICRCIDVVKYQDKYDCDFSTAWRFTEPTDDEY